MENSSSSESLWEIRTSPIHGNGLFARRDIPAGQKIIEYIGRRITKIESLELCQANNPYIFFVDEEWDLDGSVDWNPARFTNHSCAPNCESEQDEENRIWILSRRPIKAGEELTYNYGYDLEEYRDFPCGCGAPECVGFIVAEEFIPIVLKTHRTHREAAAPIGA